MIWGFSAVGAVDSKKSPLVWVAPISAGDQDDERVGDDPDATSAAQASNVSALAGKVWPKTNVVISEVVSNNPQIIFFIRSM